MARGLRLTVVTGLGAVALVAGLAPSASGRTADQDVAVLVGLGVPAGFTQGVKTLPSFELIVEVESGATPQAVTVRLSLPAGLTWGSRAPSAADGCLSVSPVACTKNAQPDPAGTARATWIWDVVASRAGVYEVTATVEPTQADPSTANNTYTFRFEVIEAGGAATVTASAVKLVPAKPKAGAAVTASVGVLADGEAIRPTGVACVGTVGAKKIKGVPQSGFGAAACRYRPLKKDKGKRLRGSVSFTAEGAKFTRSFGVKLG